MISQLIATLQRTMKEVEWAARAEGAEKHVADLQRQYTNTINVLQQIWATRNAAEPRV